MFETQGQAKRFFVDRIVAQALREGHPLSENERWMLSFSESDPDFAVDPSRVDALESEIPEATYEDRVVGLATRVYQADLASDPAALATYQEAYGVLSRGDHYILVMLDRVMSRLVRPWWAFWR